MSTEKEKSDIPTVESLHAKIAELRASITKSNSEIREDVAALNARTESLEDTVSEVIEAKPSAPAQSTGAKLTGHVFTVGKKKIKLRFPNLNVDGRDFTEEDLILAPDTVTKLAASNPRLFTEA